LAIADLEYYWYAIPFSEFWQGNLKEKDHLEDLNVDGRITLKGSLKIEEDSMNWIHLVQDRAQ
jgi:hypothetical protein